MKHECWHITSEAHARALSSCLRVIGTPVGFDTETTGWQAKSKQSPRGRAELWCATFAWRDDYGDIKTAFCPRQYIKWLSDWCSLHYPKVGSNLYEFDCTVMENLGIPLRGIVGDIVIMSRLLDPSEMRHGLKHWGEKLGFEPDKYEDVTSIPAHSREVTVSKTTRIVRRGQISYHYVEGAESQHIRWDGRREVLGLEELWSDYPQRRDRLIDYAVQDAVMALVVYEHLAKKLGELDGYCE